jgi:hypothetical protein
VAVIGNMTETNDRLSSSTNDFIKRFAHTTLMQQNDVRGHDTLYDVAISDIDATDVFGVSDIKNVTQRLQVKNHAQPLGGKMIMGEVIAAFFDSKKNNRPLVPFFIVTRNDVTDYALDMLAACTPQGMEVEHIHLPTMIRCAEIITNIVIGAVESIPDILAPFEPRPFQIQSAEMIAKYTVRENKQRVPIENMKTLTFKRDVVPSSAIVKAPPGLGKTAIALFACEAATTSATIITSSSHATTQFTLRAVEYGLESTIITNPTPAQLEANINDKDTIYITDRYNTAQHKAMTKFMVMDEAHKLTTQGTTLAGDDRGTANDYRYHNAFHLYNAANILLLSATLPGIDMGGEHRIAMSLQQAIDEGNLARIRIELVMVRADQANKQIVNMLNDRPELLPTMVQHPRVADSADFCEEMIENSSIHGYDIAGENGQANLDQFDKDGRMLNTALSVCQRLVDAFDWKQLRSVVRRYKNSMSAVLFAQLACLD